jgi:hypothetical protein
VSAPITIDLPPVCEFEVTRTVTIGTVAVRILKDPSPWLMVQTADDPLAAVKAYVHPDDWSALNNLLLSRRDLPTDKVKEIVNALTSDSGHPTNEPDGS